MGPLDAGRNEHGTADSGQDLGTDSLEFKALTEQVAARLSSALAPESLRYTMPDSDEIDSLCAILVDPDDEAFRRHVAQLQASGVTIETLYCGYLAGAARRLGEMWHRDEVSFFEMTCATGRINQGLHAIVAGSRGAAPDPVRRAFFAAVPGETHTLGVVMAAELFRQRGWDIGVGMELPARRIVRRVCEGRYPIVGLSAGGERTLPALAEVIAEMRRTCAKVQILISGPIVGLIPTISSDLGADGSALEMDEAAREMDRLLRRHFALMQPDPATESQVLVPSTV